MSPQLVAAADALELRRGLPLAPARFGDLRVEGDHLEVGLLERLDEGVVARRGLLGRHPHQGQRRRAAGAKDHAHPEEHQQREEEGPEHRPTVAQVEPPLDAELLHQQREGVGVLHRFGLDLVAQAAAGELQEDVLQRGATHVHLAVLQPLRLDDGEQARQHRLGVGGGDLARCRRAPRR